MATKKNERATLDHLLKKPPRTKELVVKSLDDSGKEIEFNILFKSIGSKRYDDLLGQHKPTKEQAKDGAQWNGETFPPALIAACAVDPEISLEDAEAIWASDDWSRGELLDLFVAVIKLNSDGLDIPFIVTG